VVADEIILLCGSSYRCGFLFRADGGGGILSSTKLDVRELIAQGLDEYPVRIEESLQLFDEADEVQGESI
jgi:hypothetical protein